MGPMIAALFSLIDVILSLYLWVLFISVILTWLVQFNVVNTRNRAVYTIGDMLHRLTEPVLRPLRRWIPPLGGIDLSPLVAMLAIYLIRQVIANYGLARVGAYAF